MKIRMCESDWEENVIEFQLFQNLSDEYQYRSKIVKELQNKEQSLHYRDLKLDQNEQNNLMFSQGFCRGYIDAVHKTMSKLKISTKEVQLRALENMQKAVSEDISREIQSLKYQLEDIREYRERKDK